jgi:hypothetical protein
MDKKEFNDYWKKEYPDAFPINHELKYVYPERWFRIHSLPESKRYADSKSEYTTIFSRQNKLMLDLVGDGTEVITAFGIYQGDDIINNNYKKITDYGEFHKVRTIDLKEARPEEHEDEMLLDIYIKRDIWKHNSRNDLLKAVANDEIRIMFICPSKRCIVAPYDGGVDIIVDSSEKRDNLKIKYKDWLSEHQDGM